MRRTIPSTLALQAFAAAARHQSFTKAGAELALTQSAICRQIAGLEDFLGIALFSRSKRGVRLTEAGQAYARRITARLDEVERDTLDLMAGRSAGGSLELACGPSFATRWLIPRLPEFQRAHPGITLNLHVRTRPFLFEDSGLDAAIHFGDAAWPGTEAIGLMREDLVAVGAPALLDAARVTQLADLAALPLLQMSTRPYAWRQWLADAGGSHPQDLAGPRFELFSMLAAAAAEGLGLALLPRFLFSAELDDGRLREALPLRRTSTQRYQLLIPEHRREDPALIRFAQWIALHAATFAIEHHLS